MTPPATRPTPRASSPAPAARSAAFGHGERVLVCAGCGAPLKVAIGGGDARCGYCGAVTRFDRREKETERPVAPSISESARLEGLRAQRNAPLEPPPSLAPLLEGGEVPASHVKTALGQWLSFRNRVAEGASLIEHERLFHLTLLLAPKLSEQHARALLENAAELVSDARHRQLLRCALAEHAVLAGDAQGAAEWLETCAERPADLQMDSAFRIATSLLASSRGDCRRVVSLLGDTVDDVPIAHGRDGEVAMLRAHALERLGMAAAARAQMVALLQSDPRRLFELGEAAERLRPVVGRPKAFVDTYGPTLVAVDRRFRSYRASAIDTWEWVARCTWASALLSALVAASLWEGCSSGQVGPAPRVVFAFAVVSAVTATISTAEVLLSRRFFARAELGFGRVVSAYMNVVETGESTRIVCALGVDVLGPTGPTRMSVSLNRSTLVPPGVYPCLVDRQGHSVSPHLDQLPPPI